MSDARPPDPLQFSRETDMNGPGMSLRDWFAGQIIAARLSDHLTEGTVDGFAKEAYLYADAMIAERSK